MIEKKSPELQAMEAEQMEAEPSLDQMVDLSDPKVLKGLGRMAEEIYQKQQAEPPRASENLNKVLQRRMQQARSSSKR